MVDFNPRKKTHTNYESDQIVSSDSSMKKHILTSKLTGMFDFKLSSFVKQSVDHEKQTSISSWESLAIRKLFHIVYTLAPQEMEKL